MGLAHGVPLVHLAAFFELRHFHGQWFAVALGHDGSVMGAAEGESTIGESVGGLDLDGLVPFDGMLVCAVVAIGQRIAGIVESFLVDVHDVRLVHGVAPAEHVIVADGGKSGAEERSAAHVPSFVAVDVPFIPLADAEEGLVRIDEEQGVAVGALGRQ